VQPAAVPRDEHKDASEGEAAERDKRSEGFLLAGKLQRHHAAQQQRRAKPPYEQPRQQELAHHGQLAGGGSSLALREAKLYIVSRALLGEPPVLARQWVGVQPIGPGLCVTRLGLGEGSSGWWYEVRCDGRG